MQIVINILAGIGALVVLVGFTATISLIRFWFSMPDEVDNSKDKQVRN